MTNMETNELTAERIAELRRLHEAATPGPWHFDDGVNTYGDYSGQWQQKDNPATVCPPGLECDHCQSDGILIAEMRNALLPMLDEIERLRADNERLQEALRRMTECAEARK